MKFECSLFFEVPEKIIKDEILPATATILERSIGGELFPGKEDTESCSMLMLSGALSG